MTLLIADNTFERIKQYYSREDLVLNPEDDAIRVRWASAFMQLHDRRTSDRTVVLYLIKTFEVSEATAYRDLANARRLFGDIRAYTKEAFRYHVTQWSVDMFRMAEVKKDLKGMEKALERITKAMNLDKEDQDLPDPSKIQPPTQILMIQYNFITSPYFKMIDKTAQEKLLLLHDKFLSMAEELGVRDYLDELLIEEPTSEDVTD